ncbi:uncharacterized protein LOC117899240 [Drosophila subobscura]|uniref:uncharacterized protein LOC117899240 n=1 Tax=Drosophila subobscura TaxID=7241 RepID=UPI00155B3BD8|nr:uncharacterized protein LOC117899240 [Drosophila subobscura]
MLSNLPLEIILKVFGYLSAEDKLQLAQVNQTLGSAFVYHSEAKYKRLSCYLYTGYELSVILPLCGSNIYKIDISEELTEKTAELITKYCTNVESATLEIRHQMFNACKGILSIKSLSSIYLVNGDYREPDMLQYFNPNCRVLTLFDLSNVQSQNLRRLIHLEDLDVAPFDYLTDMLKICSHLKKLRCLKLTYCKLTQEEDFLYPELETLQVSYSKIYSDLPRCPNLKQLSLILNEYHNSVKIINFIVKYATTLERLVITIAYDEHHPFTAHNLLDALRECTNLQFLHINCFLLKNLLSENVETFIKVLKANCFDAQRRFVLEVSQTALWALVSV